MSHDQQPDLAARDLILEECRDLKIGDRAVFFNEMFHAAWLPTGVADARMTALGVSVGEFKSLAAAFAGNRPIDGESPIEALRDKLGPTFSVNDLPDELAIEVKRVLP